MWWKSEIRFKKVLAVCGVSNDFRTVPVRANSNVAKEKELLVLDDGISICPNEFIIAMFEDGPYPGEIISFDDTNVTINFLESATINKQRSFKYWKWPTIIDQHTVNKLSILPIRPSLDIATQYSNNRNVVFELLNFDLVMKFE